MASTQQSAERAQRCSLNLELPTNYLRRELVARVSRTSGFNVLRQTQTAYNRFQFPERSPKPIKNSK